MKRLRSLILLPALFLCAGCVFPYSHLDARSPRSPVDDEALSFIVVGSTTAEDVILQLGEPTERFEAPTVFLYHWVLSKGAYWFLVAAAPYRAFVGGGDLKFGTFHYTLHIAFDDDNKVTRFKVSKY